MTVPRGKPRHKPRLLQDDGDRHDAHHHKPKKQERRVAKAIGGRRQPGSGAGVFARANKGDVHRADKRFPMLVECKRTSGKESLRLEALFLTKITHESIGKGAHPGLAIQFDDDVMSAVARKHGYHPAEADWVAIPLTTLKAMLEELGENTSWIRW